MEKKISVNLDGAFLMSKAFVPVMKNNHFGRIVNVASTTFWLNAPEMTAYIASKGGVIGFTRALALIKCFCVSLTRLHLV